MSERTVSVSNLSNQAIGVFGGILGPSSSVSKPLHYLIGNASYTAELASYVTSGIAVVGLDGDSLTADQVLNLAAPISGELVVRREVFTNPAAADPNAFKTAFTASATAVTYVAANFTGVIGSGVLSPPRNLTITGTTGGGEALSSKAVVITYKDINNVTRSETITTTVLGASDTITNSSVGMVKQLVSAYFPLEAGTPGDYEIGFGSIIGLSAPLSQGGMVAEFLNNAIAVAGTVVLSGTSAPNGSYLPNTVPNATNDYILVYIPS